MRSMAAILPSSAQIGDDIVTPTEKRQRFRALLTAPGCVHPADVFDPLSARMAEDLGFECGMFAGSVASMVVLGAPDLVLVTLTEFADQVRRICRAANLPLMCDADHGYGNALNVKRTVEELEVAGISAITIEDTLLPTPFSDASRKGATSGLIPIPEGVGKMHAARAARRDPSLVIAGRTSALALSTIEDTIARMQAYEAAGVDVIFLAGAKARAQVDAVAGAIKIPLLLGGVTGELVDKDYLASRGVRICLLGQNAYLASLQAINETYKALRAGTKPAQLANLAGNDLVKRIIRTSDYERDTKAFLGA
jgi:carboxyvinyl-carboxyphosphonate phosphorylmutase